MICSIDGKPARRRARDGGSGYWCDMHYSRWLKHGDPLWTTPIVSERFWAKVDRNGPIHPQLGTRCWVWTASPSSDGYGRFTVSPGNHGGSHRYALGVAMGMFSPWLDELDVDHRCHNRLCVRPSHLRPVTRKQNIENRGVLNCNNTSGVRGVYWNRTNKKWIAQVTDNGKTFYVGSFVAVADAEAAVIAKRLELFTHNDLDRTGDVNELVYL